ncbi:MAG: transposase [Oscillospiraceae bacterium]|jgi:REP element-mobilizing transposase RayT|nr:transposase [Oscillospiraceae bacterium]
MPRKARVKSSTEIYHVMIRGINKQTIFIDEEDNAKFLQIIEDCIPICEFELYGYCLMGNHAHILLKEGKETLDRVFKRIGTRYVYWFNNKYMRNGHLFQDRFKSEPIESDPYFIVALRYIHQNPLKAGICKSIDEYAWSSYHNYLGKRGIINVDFAFEIIGNDNFIAVMNEAADDNCLEDNEKIRKLSDTELINLIEDKFKIKPIMLQNEPKEIMDDILKSILKLDCVTTRQLSRITGISINKIWTL